MTIPSDLPAAAHQARVLLLRELKGVVSTNAPFQEPIAVPKDKKVSTRKGGVSPVTTYVRSLPGGPFFTAQEVADEIKCSVQAIRKYAKLPKEVLNAPSYVAPFGKIRINLYTKQDIKEIKQFLDNRRQVISTEGLPPMQEPASLKESRNK